MILTLLPVYMLLESVVLIVGQNIVADEAAHEKRTKTPYGTTFLSR
jgi:hypothetical protein